MLKYAVTLTAILAASYVTAEELPGRMLFPVNTQCTFPADEMVNLVENKYGEIAFAEGEAVLQSYNTGKHQFATFKLYVNPDEQTWSLVTFMNQGPACLISSGTGFKPALNTTY